MNEKYIGLLDKLIHAADARSARISSYDQSGRNQDYWMIPSGSSVVLGEIEGPGCIKHIWMTSFCRRVTGPSIIDPIKGSNVAPVFEISNALGLNQEITDPYYYRKVLFKIIWDDQKYPSVLVPFGDFFCVGHSMPSNFTSIPFSVTVKPKEDPFGEKKFGSSASLNCYLPMPFNKKAKIEIINENDVPFGLYFHIDYEIYKENFTENLVYFHSKWNRECPCNGWGPDLLVNSPEVNSVKNIDGKDNYIILDTKGCGHYIGCNLSVYHFQGSWWGEGDDMIFIDGEEKPSIHGTGSEEYFNHAWGMQNKALPFGGSILHESEVPGYQVSYRFHIMDPIHFKKSIRVTLEHGHANHLSDDWSSTAYWYQKLPSSEFGILPVTERIPIAAKIPKIKKNIFKNNLSKDMKDAISSQNKTKKEYQKERNEQTKIKIEKVTQNSKGNIEHSKRIRDSFV